MNLFDQEDIKIITGPRRESRYIYGHGLTKEQIVEPHYLKQARYMNENYPNWQVMSRVCFIDCGCIVLIDYRVRIFCETHMKDTVTIAK